MNGWAVASIVFATISVVASAISMCLTIAGAK